MDYRRVNSCERLELEVVLLGHLQTIVHHHKLELLQSKQNIVFTIIIYTRVPTNMHT